MFIRIFMMKFLLTRLLLLTDSFKSTHAPLNSFKRLIPSFPLLLFILLIQLASCKKDPYTIGYSLLPPTDTLAILTNDTCTLIAYSELQDSIRSDRTKTSILGSFIDPVFGKTTASFCTQVRLSSEGVDFGTDPVLDSVVLMLRYSSVYGDSTALQNVTVYEVDEDLAIDTAYYSTRKVKHYSTPLADMTFKPNLTDSIKVGDVKLLPHLRINLSKMTNYFGNKILYAPSTTLKTNTSFLKFIKGLYIETSPVSYGGSLISFNMSSDITKLVVYFHNYDSTGTLKDSLNYDFLINTSSARYNYFDHNQYLDATPEFREQVISKDTALGKNKLYVQGLGGVRIKVRLPYLNNFSKKMALNSAKLILKNFETDTTLAPPPQLTLMQVDSAGKVHQVVDQSEGSAYFGGTYSASTHSYQFRLTRHIQQVILGKIKNNDLYLMVNNPSSNTLLPQRMIGIGTNPDNPTENGGRFQLQLIYTKRN
jgi:hypothetical protein